MKRLNKTKFWLSVKGNVFEAKRHINFKSDRRGLLALPDEYPYTAILLPSIRSEEEMFEWRSNTTIGGVKIKDIVAKNRKELNSTLTK